MFAKYLLIINLFSGYLVLQCLADEVPLHYPDHPEVHQKPGQQHQDHTGTLERPAQQSDHAHFPHDPPYGHHLHHTDFFHHVPPAPEPAASNYIATLSYGEGYPTVIYHCSLTEHKPTTPFVYGPNGHVCTVSFLKDTGHYYAHDDDHHHVPHKNPLTVLLDLISPPHQEGRLEPFIPMPVPVLFG